MPLNMQPLSDKFGVAITNVDLSKDIDQNPFDEIVDVFVSIVQELSSNFLSPDGPNLRLKAT
jgi:hypothetical protein